MLNHCTKLEVNGWLVPAELFPLKLSSNATVEVYQEHIL